jgi:hypothetical protein
VSKDDHSQEDSDRRTALSSLDRGAPGPAGTDRMPCVSGRAAARSGPPLKPQRKVVTAAVGLGPWTTV